MIPLQSCKAPVVTGNASDSAYGKYYQIEDFTLYIIVAAKMISVVVFLLPPLLWANRNDGIGVERWVTGVVVRLDVF